MVVVVKGVVEFVVVKSAVGVLVVKGAPVVVVVGGAVVVVVVVHVVSYDAHTGARMRKKAVKKM